VIIHDIVFCFIEFCHQTIHTDLGKSCIRISRQSCCKTALLESGQIAPRSQCINEKTPWCY